MLLSVLRPRRPGSVPLRTLSALALALLVGCASSGSSSPGGKARLRVSLHDFAHDQLFELVSVSHTSPVDYYSKERSDASRKIQTDEAMDAMLNELEKRGFDEYLKDGPAPTSGHGVVARSFEVERGGSLSHWEVGKGSPPEELKAFNDCFLAFLQVYNITSSFQSVQNDKGDAFFQDSKARTATGGKP